MSNNPDFQEARCAMQDMIDNIDVFINYAGTAAKLNKVYYEELLHQGFTETQALELVKVHGMPVTPGVGGNDA